jgi:hypothetical protein
MPTSAPPPGIRHDRVGSRYDILSLASDLKDIMGEAMELATITFPLKHAATLRDRTLSRHMWPMSVKHDVATIRGRTKAPRHLARIASRSPYTLKLESVYSDPTQNALWLRITTPLELRIVLSRPIRVTASLSITQPDGQHDSEPVL